MLVARRAALSLLPLCEKSARSRERVVIAMVYPQRREEKRREEKRSV
jgi:hypothetical protein